MTERQKINILLVDDQPGKLLSLETILEDLGENLIKAGSADEALRHLLASEIAVVLIDVCMPSMDGFELAEMIRAHPRYRRTAIMFISAIQLTDEDRVRGFRLGAVDYIPVPIIPEVLRAKVAVFTELYRKTEQLERLNSELEHRVAERTKDLETSSTLLKTSERRYRDLVQGLSAAVYTCDIDGRITLYNQAAVDLWGREPIGGETRICGSWKLFNPDGTPLALEDTPMAETLRDGRPAARREMIIERPDGTRRYVLPSPEPIRSDAGDIIGAVNLLTDITESKNAESVRTLLAAIVASSDDAIFSKTLDGKITSWNTGAERMFGYTADEAIGRPIMFMVPDDQRDSERQILARLGRGEHIKHFETSRVTRHGKVLGISLTVSPVRDSTGSIVGASAVARDITERKQAEAVLARDRATLERLVEERTAELDVSNQRLRMSDRLATIGTLSAGLGHDMGNLLLPIRMRLDAMEVATLPQEIKEDLAAIRQASEYLQKLAASLRLLSLDAQVERLGETTTHLAPWWSEAAAMIRNGVPRSVSLSADFPESLPAVCVGPAGLTQMVFNLVQNAGDALKNHRDGRIEISASLDASHDRILITVRDNGPGMSDEARRRCLEPFFTTKTRGLSTGLGLALVNGLLQACGGQINIESTPHNGSIFTISLPADKPTHARAIETPVTRGRAVITMTDQRLGAHGQWVLRSLGYEVFRDRAPGVELWITDLTSAGGMDGVNEYLQNHPASRVILFEDAPSAHALPAHIEPRITYLGRSIKPSALKSAFTELLHAPAAV